MKKIAIFENEYQLIESIFDAVNFFFFEKSFSFEYYPSSQSFGPLSRINEYSLVFVDIDLSPKSKSDGYTLLANLNELTYRPPVIILTGHSKVAESLKEKGLPNFPIINKPLSIKDLQAVISEQYKPTSS